MEKRNKIFLILLIILTICVIGICIYFLTNNNHLDLTDATEFRSEYMELNDKINENNGETYPNVSISETNTVKYISESDAVKMLENGTGIIYFGWNSCPWCRISTLTKVAEKKKENIYYLNILNIRSSFEVKDDELVNTKKGSKEYYKILELLDSELDNYYIYDNKNKEYDTKEKRLYAPTVVAVKDGKITSIHIGTLDSQKSGYDKLDSEQLKELENIFEDLINSIKKVDACTQEGC